MFKIDSRLGSPVLKTRKAAWLRLGVMLVLLAVSGTTTVALAQSAAGSSNLRSWLGVDLFKLIQTSDRVGQMSLIVLGMFSICSWMVIVYKLLHIRQAKKQTNAFVEMCNESSGDLNEAFRLTSNYPDSPLAQILREGYLELEIENWYRDYELTPEARIDLAKIGTERVFERTIAYEITHLESLLIFLATTTNVCPFIGLFGTVWGIMGAFQAMTANASASLMALAPSLATALLTTVGGLFCAIPASVTYNYLTNQVQLLVSRMDAFSLELSNVIQKQLIKQATSSTYVNR